MEKEKQPTQLGNIKAIFHWTQQLHRTVNPSICQFVISVLSSHGIRILVWHIFCCLGSFFLFSELKQLQINSAVHTFGSSETADKLRKVSLHISKSTVCSQDFFKGVCQLYEQNYDFKWTCPLDVFSKAVFINLSQINKSQRKLWIICHG